MDQEKLLAIVERLRQQGTDDGDIEVKECVRKLSGDIWETVSAFANTSGGLILLGLSERAGFTPVEGFDPDRTRDQFVAGMGDGGSPSKLVNPPRYRIERAVIDALPVLVIEIFELDPASKPCYIFDRGPAKGSYKRVDDKDVLLSSNELFSVSTASRVDNFDREPVEGATTADFDKTLVGRTFERAYDLSPRALKGVQNDWDKLQRLNFIDEVGKVTKAGLLAAGSYPQQFFPRLVVDVAVHSGLEKGTPGAPRFLDRTVCEGTLGEMVADAVGAVAKNLKRCSVVVGAGRVDELEIPEEVIREAVANALIHRDYSPRYDGQAVSVDIFDDRVEIVNPGGLYGSKTRENLADGLSCCRNATLMKLMSLVPLPAAAGSPAEGNGSGVPMMIRECKQRGIPEPEFRPALDSFKVVFSRPSYEGREGRSLESDAVKGEEEILGALKERGELSMRELAEGLGLTVSQARYRMRGLLSSGAVVATASKTSRDRKYRLA